VRLLGPGHPLTQPDAGGLDTADPAGQERPREPLAELVPERAQVIIELVAGRQRRVLLPGLPGAARRIAPGLDVRGRRPPPPDGLKNRAG
jgi:hypothetical protein